MKDGKQLYRFLPRSLPNATVVMNFPKDIMYYLAPIEPTGEELQPLKGWITEEDLYKTLGTENLSTLRPSSKKTSTRKNHGLASVYSVAQKQQRRATCIRRL